MKKNLSQTSIVIITASILGVFSVLLVYFGNPKNTGICVSCFLENIAGAIGLHPNPRMQYLRPELLGFILGAMISALLGKEFKARATNAPLVPFIVGAFLIVGSAVFIGCPIKLFIRFGAGDLTSLAGIAGLVLGVYIGIVYLGRGFTFGDPQDSPAASAWMLPVAVIILTIFLFYEPNFIFFSKKGSASTHAPKLISLAAGLIIGAFAQRSRFCVTGSIRDPILTKSVKAGLGLIVFIVALILFNVVFGYFNFGMNGQPSSHLNHTWSFLGMLLVGTGSVMIGGCPFRQIVRSGEGDIDAVMAVLGMITGGAFVQTFDIASTSRGVTFNGKVAVIVGFILLIIFGLAYREKDS
jgi:YedE family putative selenium metabolism protein